MNQSDPIAAAEQAIRSGDTTKACEILRSILGDPELFIDARLALAKIHLHQKQHSSAEKLLLEVIAQAPSHAYALALLSHTLRIQGKTDKAARHLDRASQIKSASQQDLKFVASEYIALEAFQAAICTLKKVDPMDAQSFYHLGLAHFRLGEIGKALPIYRKLFSSIPDSPTIARELSLVAAVFREYDTAVEAYSRYMQLIQPGATDYLKFGDLQLMNRNVTESEKHLERAIAMGENSTEARLLQARLSRLKGDYSRSLTEAQFVATVRPDSGTAWQIIAELIEASAVDATLISRLAEAVASSGMNNQDRELAQFALAELYSKQKDYAAAYRQMHAANLTKKRALHCHGIQYDHQLVEAQFEAVKQAFTAPTSIKASNDPHRPVFIVGMPRSGTTIINRLLEVSGQLQCIGESEAIPYIHAQQQLRFGKGSEKFAQKLTVDEWSQLAADYLQHVKGGKLQVVDKMPSNYLYIGMILSMFPHARIVQLRRNPFDVCMSIFAKPFPEGHSYACDVKDLAHYYFQSNALMDFWSQTYPKQVIDLDFDQFLESPETTGKQLFSFLEYEWQEEYLAPPQNTSQAFTFSELQVRKPITKREADKWQPFACAASDLATAIQTESSKSSQSR